MTQQTADVIVVGAGIMGASAAWHLARRGIRVALLEQFERGHRRGSSHGAARIFRFAYDQLDYLRLAQAALPLWREAEQELGQDLLWTTGGIDAGAPEHLAPVAETLRAAGSPFERLTPEGAARRFPAFRLPEGWEALYQADYGVVFADRSRLGFADLARRAGAQIAFGTAVTRLLPSENMVTVETTDGSWQAGRVVLAAAGWTNKLLAPLGVAVPMTVTREHVLYYPYRDDRRLVPFIWHLGPVAFEMYGLPNGTTDEAKIGRHKSGPEVDPDTEPVVEEAQLEPARRFVRDHLPALADAPSSADTCLYASTPDDDFVLDTLGPIVLGVGFGGHGYKFGAVIGAMLADLVEGKAIASPERFTLARFQETPIHV